MEKLINIIIGLFSGLKATRYGGILIVFIISILPILELRGGLLAATLLEVDPFTAYIVSIIGNLLPIPFILFFIKRIIAWLRKSKIKFFNKIAKFLDEKVEKNKDKIEKYGYLGLLLFVGVPLPGTGAWTGCLVASVLDMDRKKSFVSILCGVLMASIIMMVISYGILGRLI
jgi:uncharacterized membrane protein